MAAQPRETAWTESLRAYESLKRRSDARAALVLEAALEDLYTQAYEHGQERLRALAGVLAVPPVPSAARAWRGLVDLCLACDDATLDRLDGALAEAPPRTAWLVASEAARLVYQAVGPRAAWRRIAPIEPVPAAESWLDDGPLVIHAVLLKLRLAAASGNWPIHDELLVPSEARFGGPRDPRGARVRMTGADHDVMRGHYQRAAATLDELEPHCRGDLRLELLAIRLHALVACAADQRDTWLAAAIDETLTAIDQALPAAANEADALPAPHRRELVARIAHLREHAGAYAHEIEVDQVESLASALAVERRARRGQTHRPAGEVLADLLPRVEALLLCDDADEHLEAWLTLRLLWCRLIVDTVDTERYEACEAELTTIIEDATSAGLLPIAMSGHDQRAVVRTREPIAAWDRALADAGEAGHLAVRLLAYSSSPPAGAGARVMERALLGTLLPVLDRVIDLLLVGAGTIEHSGGRTRAGWDGARHDRWLRFGRAVHDYVEQSQVLALKEARHAYGAGDTPIPHRFALVAPGQEPASPLPRLQQALRPGDAVVQYFVTGRFLVVFIYDREYFDWVTVDVVAELGDAGSRLGAPTAHAGLLHVLAECDTWLKGESAAEHEASAALLCQLLLPDVVVAHLEKSGAKHVRIVPHDVLYRVPFGRLRRSGAPLAARVSLSLHPTAGLAAESAATMTRPHRRKTLGYLLGPGLARAARERAVMQESLGRRGRLASMRFIDASGDTPGPPDTDAIVRAIQDVDILHVACHGGRPFQRREASMKLGTGPLTLSRVASLHMRQCALVVLQSCWTGWMEHERTNPVQGFPQAMCDAGVAAVIAPLVKVPDTLTPVFAQVLYRMLRFLPAERALCRALELIREHGPELVADDQEASRDLRELGPLDVVEYRYVGRTGLNLGGGLVSRLMGRVSLWWWQRALQRSRARRAAAGPLVC
ncbi:MAG TPA: CHAT domain-containing protein [Kofleriaceae bacterium]|nr:CHAT domain-containing protein [Kofleriaceae bacterium]